MNSITVKNITRLFEQYTHVIHKQKNCASGGIKQYAIYSVNVRSESFKVIDTEANWKFMYNFLLVINSNCDSVSHHL